ncbi:MAG: ATP-binding protein [Synechococcales bacterium]|nr:ATP-binding protein [Synechococcales bacterium]
MALTQEPHHRRQPRARAETATASTIRREQSSQFLSLRVKLLVGFSLVFSIVFAGAFYWFYTFTTDKTISRLRADLRSTLEGAVAGLDVDELMELYAEGERNAEGFSDDPRYQRQIDWFETVKSIEPRAWLYSFKVGNPTTNRREGVSPVVAGQPETVYLVDLWANYDPSKAVRFLEPDDASSRARLVVETGTLIEEPKIYSDDWGTWLSAFAPLKNDQGEVVAVLGLDIEADYVFQIQEKIRNRVLLSFVITYGILFVLIYVLSGILTRHLTELTRSAERIAAGDYNRALSLSQQHSGVRRDPGRSPHSPHLHLWQDVTDGVRESMRDEMSILAQAFAVMVESIRTRERQIREGKKIEDEMRHALETEREVNELKSRFVSMVSHEFRTPLTVIRTSSELLEQYGHLATEEKKQIYFQRIRQAIANMTQLLEDVLVVGKAEAGKLEFNPLPTDLYQFCQQISEEMQQSIGPNHDIVLTADGDFSNAQIDPNLLRPVLSNLLSNAIKYSPVGTTVYIRLANTEAGIVLEVVDEGIGIPAADQPKLFELFHRASNVSAIRGTGLGLAIVKQCVSHHQGDISFVSRENSGTTFRVVLPHIPVCELSLDSSASDEVAGQHSLNQPAETSQPGFPVSPEAPPSDPSGLSGSGEGAVGSTGLGHTPLGAARPFRKANGIANASLPGDR